MAVRIPKSNTAFEKFNQDDFAVYAQAIHDGLDGNLTFPTPPVLPAALQTLINTYTAALAGAVLLGKENIAIKNEARFALENAIRANSSYVNQTVYALISSGTSYEDAIVLILSSGYELSKDPVPAGPLSAPEIITYRSTVKGQLYIKVSSDPNAKSYIIRLRQLAPTLGDYYFVVRPNTRILIDDLPSGSTYQAEVAAVGADPVRNFSIAIEQVII